jgi:hypothetical protein
MLRPDSGVSAVRFAPRLMTETRSVQELVGQKVGLLVEVKPEQRFHRLLYVRSHHI